MNNNKPLFGEKLDLPKLDFFENITANEKAEDVTIEGYILKLPKTLAQMHKQNFNKDEPLISKEKLFNKNLSDI